MVIVRKLRIAFHIKNLACSVPFIQTQETIPIAAQVGNIFVIILMQHLALMIQNEPIRIPVSIFIRLAGILIEVFSRDKIIAADGFDVIIAVCQGDAEHCRFACSLDGRSIVFRCRSQLCQLYGCGFCFCIPAKSIRIDDIAAIALQHALPIAQGNKNSAVLDFHLPEHRQLTALCPDAIAVYIKGQLKIMQSDLGKLRSV